MESKIWFSRGTKIDDMILDKLIASDQNWQIIITSFDIYILFVKPILIQKWINDNFITISLFQKYIINDEEYYLYVSKKDYLISSSEHGPFPDNIISAQSFALALKETRTININIPLHNSIFIEQISRLLPTYSVSETFDDEYLLGKWLSGGVNISIRNVNRLSVLLNWMSKEDFYSIVESANLKLNMLKSPNNENIQKITQNNEKFILKGRPELENFFNEHIIDVINNTEKYKRMGINFPSAVILHGPPGCGKTFAVNKLIDFLDMPNYQISSATIGSPFIHDTSKKISQVFDKAIETAPSIIVIDEMEAFLSSRNTSNHNTHRLEEVAEFLRRIPEATEKNVLIIAMTNMIDTIDPAILRRGRFDHILEVKMPSIEETEELVESVLSKIPHNQNINIKDISARLLKRPLSDVTFVIKEACFYAAKNDIEFIDNELIISAINKLPPIKKEEIKIGFGVH